MRTPSARWPPSPGPARASAGPWPGRWPAAGCTWPWPTSTTTGWPRRCACARGRGSRSPPPTSTWPTVRPSRPGPTGWWRSTAGSTWCATTPGWGSRATVEAMSYEDFEWLMGINFWGVVYGTKAFLPHLKASGRGSHRQRVQRVRTDQRAVPVGLQRRQVRRPGLHRRPADGAGDRGGPGVVHHRPSGRDQDQHRPQRPAWTRAPTPSPGPTPRPTTSTGWPSPPRTRRPTTSWPPSTTTAAGWWSGPDCGGHRPAGPAAHRPLPVGPGPGGAAAGAEPSPPATVQPVGAGSR